MKQSEEQRRMEEFADELRAAFPHAAVECELLDRGGAWLALQGPTRLLELQWSPETRSFGVSLDDEDADVAFSPHDQYFPTFELAKARVLSLLKQPEALGTLVARRA